MARKLHIDFETFSSIDIQTSGAYKYTESVDFEILLIGYAFDNGPINIVDITSGDKWPTELLDAFKDPAVEIHAANATFERLCLRAYGYDIPIHRFHCVIVKALYCGLAGSLSKISEALHLKEKGKLSTGKALIRYFCVPCKPTKANGERVRNLPEHAPDKWDDFKAYLYNDVESEREAERLLSTHEIPEFERENYIIDQEINDRGVLIDLNMASNAVDFDRQFADDTVRQMKELTGLTNPNSVSQLKTWLNEKHGIDMPALGKLDIGEYLKKQGVPPEVENALKGRLLLAKSSVKKYQAMLNCACYDGRAHGLFQFYGANRTGRWAGRLIQLQNLPQNHMEELDYARGLVESGDYELAHMMFDNIPTVLSELIRTAIIAPKGKTFVVSDFSAIEARVLSWIAQEQWRLDVFNSHGKIYEASASMMFGVPIELVTKGSVLRHRGKVAELALGYQGADAALETMDRDNVLSKTERKQIVALYRKANPSIVQSWEDVNGAALNTIMSGNTNTAAMCIFRLEGDYLTVELPSRRKLYYREPAIGTNRFGQESIVFKGMNNVTKQWTTLETYGGKLVENIVQAISRDLLACGIRALRQKGYEIVMHVHDEVVIEVLDKGDSANNRLEDVNSILGNSPSWAAGLPLRAEGYITQYYMKN